MGNSQIRVLQIYTSNSCKMNDMSQFIEYVCESQKSIFKVPGLITD